MVFGPQGLKPGRDRVGEAQQRKGFTDQSSRQRGHHKITNLQLKRTKLRGLYSVSELYRPSDRRLSVKSVPTLVDRRCHVVSVTDRYGRILDF
jgi:hypothetical protein